MENTPFIMGLDPTSCFSYTIYMNKQIFLLTSLFLFTACKFTEPDNDKIYENHWDELNIPDKYNTGANESTAFKQLKATGEIADGVTILVRTDTKTPFYCLSSYKTSLPDNLTIKDYDFSDYDFSTSGADRFESTKFINFENCKFKGFRNDAVGPDSHRISFTFEHCSFSGGVNSSYITLKNCKIGGFTSDAMNPLTEFNAENLYVYDLSHEGNQNGTHIDGIQIYGDQRSRNNIDGDKWISKVETGYIKFQNVRFEIPSIYYDGNTSYVNACVMFQLEFSDVDNVSFTDLYVNGGGKW